MVGGGRGWGSLPKAAAAGSRDLAQSRRAALTGAGPSAAPSKAFVRRSKEAGWLANQNATLRISAKSKRPVS